MQRCCQLVIRSEGNEALLQWVAAAEAAAAGGDNDVIGLELTLAADSECRAVECITRHASLLATLRLCGHDDSTINIVLGLLLLLSQYRELVA